VKSAEIAWGRGKAKVVIEAALDLGHVMVGKQKEEICELELELREGEPAALLELAAELAEKLALMPCDISKAERGYRLFDASSYSVKLPAPELHAETSVDDAYSALAWYLLGSSQRLAEQYRFNGHWSLLQDWVESARRVARPAGSLGQAAPRATTHDLRAALDALLEDWRTLVQAGQEDEDVRAAAHEQFIEELEDPRWGLFSLTTSRWLMARSWTVERNNRGNRQGNAMLSSWVPRFLGDEATALQPGPLPAAARRSGRATAAYRAHPGLAAPCSSHVLELPGAGSPVRRAEQARATGQLDISDEILEARKQQAITVLQSRAWKTLLKHVSNSLHSPVAVVSFSR
jgi:inorganic triphosphatase YgiF